MAVHCEREDDSPAEPYITGMESADIPQVMEIENSSFPTPWSQRAFESEVTRNRYSDYIVARIADRVVGYAGMWLVLDEAHITNIAVHPEYRGRNIGERLLRTLKERARRQGAQYMTLEVRPSNCVARALYQKHGFEKKGIRREYYSDTREDALVLWRKL